MYKVGKKLHSFQDTRLQMFLFALHANKLIQNAKKKNIYNFFPPIV